MSEFERLCEIIERLRAEDGCPWDKVQTHMSLKPGCIEEACEVINAINIYDKTGNCANLKEELGDLLLQIVMHSMIAKEEGIFDIEDVCKEICDKMIRRHPHVFHEPTYNEDGEELKSWNEIKEYEKIGKEDDRATLGAAFDEANSLIEAARKRKEI